MFQASQRETVMEASWKSTDTSCKRIQEVDVDLWKRVERQREESRPYDTIINAFYHISLLED